MQKIICLYGRPAAGKTTQAVKLAKELNFQTFGMGDCLRTEIQSGSELGQQIKKYVDEGTLISDELMEQVVRNIKPNPDTNGIIFDGFPRMLSQAKMLEKLIQESNFDFVGFFNVNVSADTARKRIADRGAKTNRPDDINQEAVNNRLGVFAKESVILFDHFGKQDLLVEIDGEASIDEVYNQLKQAINL